MPKIDPTPGDLVVEVVEKEIVLRLPNDTHLTLLPIEAAALRFALRDAAIWLLASSDPDDLWIERLHLTHPFTAGDRCQTKTPELARREQEKDWRIVIATDDEFADSDIQIEFCNHTVLPMDEPEIDVLCEILRKAYYTAIDGFVDMLDVGEEPELVFTMKIRHGIVDPCSPDDKDS